MKQGVFSFYALLLLFFALLWPAESRAAGQKVTWNEIEWQLIKTPRFNIYFPAGYENLARIAARYAEEAALYLSEKFSHNLGQVVSVFVYPSNSLFQATNILPFEIDEGMGAFTEPVKRRIAIPFSGSYDQFRHVLSHEVVHAFQYDLIFSSLSALGPGARNMPPLWLVEGMAEYFSAGWDETVDMTMREEVLAASLPGLEQMSNMQVKSAYMLYKGGQSFMQYAAEKYGEKKIMEFFLSSRDYNNLDAMIRATFGLSTAELEQDWHLWLKRKYSQLAGKTQAFEEKLPMWQVDEPEKYQVLHPAISPDGKSIVYITQRGFLPVIALTSLEQQEADQVSEKKKYNPEELLVPIKEKILIKAGNNSAYFKINLLDNRISFTGDSTKIFFSAHSRGHDVLVLYDLEKNRELRRWQPAVDMIQHPRVSSDGSKAVFTGIRAGQSDLYLLDLQSEDLQQLTSDLFAEREPCLSLANDRVIYSSNFNEQGDYENRQYGIFELEPASGRQKQIISGPGIQLSPVYVAGRDGEKILYAGSGNGIYNVMLFDPQAGSSERLTDVSGGVFEPQLSGQKLFFTIYSGRGYTAAVKTLPEKIPKFSEEIVFKPRWPNYSAYKTELPGLTAAPGHFSLSIDQALFGLMYSGYYGLGGFLIMSMSDFPGNHHLNINIDSISGGNNGNFQLQYGFLKKRIKIFAGAFRASNYYSIFNLVDLATINDILYNPGFLTYSILRYGAYAGARYPFNEFWYADAQLSVSYYQELFYSNLPANYSRPDIRGNIHSASLAIGYNNVLYSYFGPLKGSSFSYSLEKSLPLSASDYSFFRQNLDFRSYFTFFDRYTLALRLHAANISGADSRFFPFQLGGFNSVRGYDFLSIKGSSSALANLELRYPLVDAVAFGFPVPWVIRGFSGVVFLDAGTAFDSLAKWQAFDQKGASQDLKLSWGLGVRFVLFPGMLIKIDWATPWDLRSALPISRWQGTFSLGYEF